MLPHMTVKPINEQDYYPLDDEQMTGPLTADRDAMLRHGDEMTAAYARYIGDQALAMIRLDAAICATRGTRCAAHLAYRDDEQGIDFGLSTGDVFLVLHRCAWPLYDGVEESRQAMSVHITQVLQCSPALLPYTR